MRVLVTGARGQLGTEVVAVLGRRAAEVVRGPALEILAAGHDDLDIARRDPTVGLITTFQPDVIVNTAAYNAVDQAESDPDRAFAVNALGTRHLQEGARLVGAHLAHVSTDYVFDGSSSVPYTEWDLPRPLSVYGRSKLGGELEIDSGATLVRTSWVCGRYGANFVKTVLRLAAGNAPLRFVVDQHGSPTVASDLAETLVELALGRRPGIFHVTNTGATTWFELARSVIEAAGGDPRRVEPIQTSELVPPRPAPRPMYSVLDNMALRLEGFAPLPDWHAAIGALVGDLVAEG